MELANKNESKSVAFVKFVINCIENEKGATAALCRADNPSMAYQSWEYLARFSVDLTQPSQRLPFGLIAAAIAKGKIHQDGSLGIGEAIALCYSDGKQSDQAKAKLRRLLSCDTVSEVCLVLRLLLGLIEAKCKEKPNYARLLGEILHFESDGQHIKSKWAQNFYRSNVDEEVSP
jgi:CRISPR system Cascade subunit CasB